MQYLKSNKMTISMLLLLIIAITLGVISAEASGGGFTVTPIFPENQVPETGGFFDLMVKPGMNQNIQVNITNTSSTQVSVSTITFTPTTNINGIIDYGSPGMPDETLEIDFAEVAIPEREVTILTPGETKTLTITLSVPEQGFDGTVLGAIHTINNITDDEIAVAQETGTIINRFTYAIPVRLQITQSEIEPELVFGGISTRLINHRAAIVAEIRNPLPRVTRDVFVSAEVFPQGESNPAFERERIEVEFAPHSIFPLAFVDEAGEGLRPGLYDAVIRLEREDRVWEFSESFEIEAAEAIAMNEGALNLQEAHLQSHVLNTPNNVVVWILVVTGCIIALLVIILIIILKINRDKIVSKSLLKSYQKSRDYQTQQHIAKYEKR